jgi:geranylgeranyl diphosphate synthase, type II
MYTCRLHAVCHACRARVPGVQKMRHLQRIESAIERAVARAQARGAPPRLAAAVAHAVFPGGARIRPQLCLAVSAACGDSAPALADAAACALELLHCASLVHDDLPCFDNALTRRGRPSVHAAYGERVAVLCGDALIVLAYETLALAAAPWPQRLGPLCRVLSLRVGMPGGIIAGQAWECEDACTLPDYQRAKTGSLFCAAVEMGALAAGHDPTAWLDFGATLGEAYQVADDIRDVTADSDCLGKPAGQDHYLGRPSVVAERGLDAALAYFEELIDQASSALPPGPAAPVLQAMLRSEAERLLPPDLRVARSAALA